MRINSNYTLTGSDFGVCGCPWKWFALGKGDRALLATSN